MPARVLYAIIVTFPLILSCHFKVQFPNDPFKPEYIIPQLVLQWLRSQTDIEGLCFVSTQVDFDQVPLPFSLNYVFPVPRQRDRYSSFLARFFSSVPFVPTQGNVDANYQTVNPGSRYFDLHGTPTSSQFYILAVMDPVLGSTPYLGTIWGRLDHLLENTTTTPMNSAPEAARISATIWTNSCNDRTHPPFDNLRASRAILF